MRISSRVIVCLWCCMAALAQAQTLPRESRVPGGIAHVPLDGVNGVSAPEVLFAGEPVMVVAHRGGWLALVGLPLDIAPGDYNAVARVGDEWREFRFTVAAKAYPTQYLQVPQKRHVEPDPDELARIEQERTQLTAAFATRSARAAQLHFEWPAAGRLSSAFGLRRFFNGQARKPHSGLDIAAPIGTRVSAPAAGHVIATGDFFFNGNTVIVDHGQGLVTLYCHLARIDVEVGQELRRGEKLGEIGNTGRATGPHLHWTVSLNKHAVDPLLFLASPTPAADKPRSR